MLSRAEILKKFGLPDRATFRVEPAHDAHGILTVKVAYDKGASIHMRLGHAERLADTIRTIDQSLAEQIDACVKQARADAKNSN